MARRARRADGSPVLMFVAQPKGLEPEFDFTTFDYFYECEAGGNVVLTTLSAEMLGNLMLAPSTANLHHHKLKMRKIGGDGTLLPAHLPNINDWYPLSSEFKQFVRWALGAYPCSGPAKPRELLPAMAALDPIPVLRILEAEPFKLDMWPLRLHVATYSDGFQLITTPDYPNVINIAVSYTQDTKKKPGYHSIDLDSLFLLPETSVSPLPLELKIVCWNVRDLARETLVANFYQMCAFHGPSVVILTEVRQPYENVQDIVCKLHGNYEYIHCPGVGLCGGVIVMWMEEVLNVHRPFGRFGSLELRLQGHAPSRKKLF